MHSICFFSALFVYASIILLSVQMSAFFILSVYVHSLNAFVTILVHLISALIVYAGQISERLNKGTNKRVKDRVNKQKAMASNERAIGRVSERASE